MSKSKEALKLASFRKPLRISSDSEAEKAGVLLR